MSEPSVVNPETNPQSATVMDLVRLLLTMFGPQTFGVVLLVIVWLIMVEPTMSRNSEQDLLQRKIIEEMRDTVREIKDISAHIKVTTELLDRMLIREEK